MGNPNLSASLEPYAHFTRSISRLDVNHARVAANRTILDVRLMGAATRVDEDLIDGAAEWTHHFIRRLSRAPLLRHGE